MKKITQLVSVTAVMILISLGQNLKPLLAFTNQPNPTQTTTELTVCILPPETWAQGGVLLSETLMECLGSDRYSQFMQLIATAGDAEAMEDYPRMENSLRSIIQMAPTFAHAWYMLGNTLQNQNRTEDAVPAWRTAIELNPDIDHAYYQLGLAMEQQGKLKDAVSYYQQAVDLNPDDESYRTRLNAAWQMVIED